MKKYTKFLVICIIIAVFLFLVTSLFSQQKALLSFETDTGGGAIETTMKEGFPINYIENPSINDPYSVNVFKLGLNALFWLTVTFTTGLIYGKVRHENTRH